MNPAISVVLPVHNRADVLARAIQSVLDQNLANFELIIVDDGSTDSSLSVAKSFPDDRIKVISLGENRGGNAARNAGVFVIDVRANNSTPGNDWLRTAALLLPKGRVVLDDSAKVLANMPVLCG